MNSVDLFDTLNRSLKTSSNTDTLQSTAIVGGKKKKTKSSKTKTSKPKSTKPKTSKPKKTTSSTSKPKTSKNKFTVKYIVGRNGMVYQMKKRIIGGNSSPMDITKQSDDMFLLDNNTFKKSITAPINSPYDNLMAKDAKYNYNMIENKGFGFTNSSDTSLPRVISSENNITVSNSVKTDVNTTNNTKDITGGGRKSSRSRSKTCKCTKCGSSCTCKKLKGSKCTKCGSSCTCKKIKSKKGGCNSCGNSTGGCGCNKKSGGGQSGDIKYVCPTTDYEKQYLTLAPQFCKSANDAYAKLEERMNGGKKKKVAKTTNKKAAYKKKLTKMTVKQLMKNAKNKKLKVTKKKNNKAVPIKKAALIRKLADAKK